MLIEKSDCFSCEKADDCSIAAEAKKFLRIKNAMRKADLNTVPAQLAAIPNNALMCDKYYGKIWREAGNLKKVEQRIERLWYMLPQYLLRLELLIKVAETVGANGGLIFERIVSFKDSTGIVNMGEPVESIKVLFAEKVIQYAIIDEKIVISGVV